MRSSFRRTAVITTAVFGLTGLAVAAPPGADNPAASTGGSPGVASQPGGGPGGGMPAMPNAGQARTNGAPSMSGTAQAPTTNGMATNGMATGPNTDQASNARPGQENMEARVEQRIADMQSKLQISAAQKPQWEHLTQIMRQNARDMDRAFQSRLQSLDTMNAEDNIKSYASIAENHARATQRLVPVFDALYAKLSESQKRTADELFRDAANRAGTGPSNG